MHTVVPESEEPKIFAGFGLISCTSSATSSSMSVVLVPLEVTGDGPTMSLGIGLISCMPFEDAPSVELGRRFECSMELLADLTN